MKTQTRKRRALRGGGFSTTPSPLFPTGGFMAPRETIDYRPENGLAHARPGMLVNEPNPSLAQTPMAGGRRRHRKTMRGGGCTACQRGGGLSYAPVGSMDNLAYGIAGKGGFETVPESVAGPNSPNVGALIAPNTCYPSFRSTMTGGSRRRHRRRTLRGGGGSTYAGADCYHGTGSALPMYPNPSAGFNQSPSTWSLPQGVANAFQIYNPVVARVGGARKRKSSRK
jgi:hypothetical protein